MNKDDVIFLLFYASVLGPFLTYMLMSTYYNRKLSRLRSEQSGSALRSAEPGPVRTDFGLSLGFGCWDESRLNKLRVASSAAGVCRPMDAGCQECGSWEVRSQPSRIPHLAGDGAGLHVTLIFSPVEMWLSAGAAKG